MKATIEYEFEVDGKCPSDEMIEDAIWKLVSEAGYIASEEIDGSDEWGLEIDNISVYIQK